MFCVRLLHNFKDSQMSSYFLKVFLVSSYSMIFPCPVSVDMCASVRVRVSQSVATIHQSPVTAAVFFILLLCGPHEAPLCSHRHGGHHRGSQGVLLSHGHGQTSASADIQICSTECATIFSLFFSYFAHCPRFSAPVILLLSNTRVGAILARRAAQAGGQGRGQW